MKKRIDPAQTEMFTPLEVFNDVGAVDQTLRGFLYGRPDGAYRLSLQVTVNTLWTRWDTYSARALEWKACIEGCFLAPATLVAAQCSTPKARRDAKQRLEQLEVLSERASLMLEKDYQTAIHAVRGTVLAQWKAEEVKPEIMDKAIGTFIEWMNDEYVRQHQDATPLRDLARGALARHTPPEKKAKGKPKPEESATPGKPKKKSTRSKS